MKWQVPLRVVAEEMANGKISTSALSDLEKLSKQACNGHFLWHE